MTVTANFITSKSSNNLLAIRAPLSQLPTIPYAAYVYYRLAVIGGPQVVCCLLHIAVP
jgi:hypothetical protein